MSYPPKDVEDAVEEEPPPQSICECQSAMRSASSSSDELVESMARGEKRGEREREHTGRGAKRTKGVRLRFVGWVFYGDIWGRRRPT